MNKLSNYTSKAPEFMKLPEGNSDVRLVSYHPTDSFHNYDGTLKEALPQYTNPCEQLAITVVAISGKGVLTHRLNTEGYAKFSELSDAEVKSNKFTDVNGYTCAVNPKTKQLERLVDANKTATCTNILDQFMSSTGLPAGSSINDLDKVIASKSVFSVTVVNEPFEGSDQLRISRFKKTANEPAKKVDIEA